MVAAEAGQVVDPVQIQVLQAREQVGGEGGADGDVAQRERLERVAVQLQPVAQVLGVGAVAVDVVEARVVGVDDAGGVVDLEVQLGQALVVGDGGVEGVGNRCFTGGRG